MTPLATPGVRLVPPSQADLATLAEIVNQAFYTHDLMKADRTSADGLVEEAGPDGEFIVLEDADTVLACAMIRPIDPINDGCEGYVPPAGGLYFGLAGVRPGLMRTGLGKQLVTAAETEGRRRGCAYVGLTTMVEFDLVPYYERLGYRPVAEEHFEAGHWEVPALHTVVHFEKSLAAPIRSASPDEAAAIAALVNEAYRVEDFFKVGDRTDEAEIRDMFRDTEFLVTGDPGAIAGCVYVSVSAGRAHFGMLSVDPAVQGSGLGRRLVAAVEDLARATGCTDVDLEYVNLRQELPAFYTHLGYRECGEAPWPDSQLHRISQPAHFVLMTKQLAAIGGRE